MGREGVGEVQGALGAQTLTSDIMLQTNGVVFRSDSAAVRNLCKQSPAVREALAGFANVLHAQVAQTAACNSVHEVTRRLARWLLMVRDRSEDDTLNLTHEMIALMLGVRRPGVTIAASSLQRAGLTRYTRRRLNIIDRGASSKPHTNATRLLRRIMSPSSPNVPRPGCPRAASGQS